MWTKCGNRSEGNVAAWPFVSSYEKLLKLEMNQKQLCLHNTIGPVMIPSVYTFQEAITACQQLKSVIHVYKDSISKSLPLPQEYKPNYVWSGHKRDNLTGEFKSILDHSLLNATNLMWLWGQPNGGDLEECSILNKGYSTYSNQIYM